LSKLATKAITDRLTRILVIFGACAGLCYTKLWYFPALVGIGGVTAIIWDMWLSRMIAKLQAKRRQRRMRQQSPTEENGEAQSSIPLSDLPQSSASYQRRVPPVAAPFNQQVIKQEVTNAETAGTTAIEVPPETACGYTFSPWTGIAIMVAFFASFVAILVARGAVKTPPLILDLFANMYLAGTIIFGGGPVVIPLLREYTVQPGWVSSRDFLIGLAIIQVSVFLAQDTHTKRTNDIRASLAQNSILQSISHHWLCVVREHHLLLEPCWGSWGYFCRDLRCRLACLASGRL
jgi:hypothetical protein